MLTREYCRYIRTYSELEGLQRAHTLLYCANATAQGVEAEVRCEQGGRVRRSAAMLDCSFSRAMQLMRYLCENGVEPEQWLDVLQDAGQTYRLPENRAEPDDLCQKDRRNLDFCALCPV